MTANDLYQNNRIKLQDNIETLLLKLSDHQDKQEQDCNNYGFAGDVGYAKEVIKNLIEFFEDKE